MVLIVVVLFAIFQFITYWYWKKRIPSYSLIYLFLCHLAASIFIFAPLCEFIFENQQNEVNGNGPMYCGLLVPPHIFALISTTLITYFAYSVYSWVKKEISPIQ